MTLYLQQDGAKQQRPVCFTSTDSTDGPRPSLSQTIAVALSPYNPAGAGCSPEGQRCSTNTARELVGKRPVAALANAFQRSSALDHSVTSHRAPQSSQRKVNYRRRISSLPTHPHHTNGRYITRPSPQKAEAEWSAAITLGDLQADPPGCVIPMITLRATGNPRRRCLPQLAASRPGGS